MLETMRLNQIRDCPGCKRKVNPFLKISTVVDNKATAICPCCDTEFTTPVTICPRCGGEYGRHAAHGSGFCLSTEEFERVDGRWVCPHCGKMARDHRGDSVRHEGNFVRLCDGRLAKL